MQNIDPFYLYIAAGAAIALMAIWILYIELRLRKIFKGKRGKDLESVINSLISDLNKLDNSVEQIEKYLQNAEKRLRQSVQQVGIVRFNPFEDSGSNQSFAIALLNEKGSGVVVSSLYGRDKIRVFAKPVLNYKSEYPLSEEERKSIEEAKLKND